MNYVSRLLQSANIKTLNHVFNMVHTKSTKSAESLMVHLAV